MALPSWLLNPLSGAVSSVGSAFHLPEMGVSEAIKDPTRSVLSANRNNLNTQAVSQQIPWSVAAPQNQGGVLGASTYGGSVGGQGGAATAAPAYDPNVDPTMVNQARGLVTDDQNKYNGLYNQLNPMLSQYANEARGRVDTQYGQQQTANDKSYASGVAGTNAAYGGRGAYDSSYRGDDISTAKDAYNQSNQSLSDQKNSALAGIGSTISGVQSQLNNKPQYDLSQYKDVNALTQLHNELGQHIASLESTKQQLTPQGELVQKLNSVAAPVSNLDATIKSQLDGLVKANTPSEALNPLATSYLTRAGITDPAKQQNYFDYLKSLTQKTA